MSKMKGERFDLALSLYISNLSHIMNRFDSSNIASKKHIISGILIPFMDRYADEALKLFGLSDMNECVYFLNSLVDRCDSWTGSLQVWEEALLYPLIKTDIDNLISSYQAEEGAIVFSHFEYLFKVKRYGHGAYRIGVYVSGRYLLEVYKAVQSSDIESISKALIDEVISVSSIYDLTLYRQSLYDECMNNMIEKWTDKVYRS